ncbi:MAG: hypothetical protein ABIB43_00410 [archaeon]
MIDQLHRQFMEENGYEVIFQMPLSLTGVYKVYKDAKTRIMKCAVQTEKDFFTYNHVERESETLLDLEGLEGITHRVDYHEKELNDHNGELRIVGLVKEYVEGRKIEENELITNPNYKEALINLAFELQNRGYYKLEFARKNIIIGLDDKPYFIDLGLAKKRILKLPKILQFQSMYDKHQLFKLFG